jgi:hypothetical protein
MIMKTWILRGVGTALLMGLAGTALADGMFIYPPDSFMYEPVQQAFIEWDEATETEALTILPTFNGDAESFAWIVPVPGLPQLELADRQLFQELDNLTRPIYRSRDGQWDCMGDNTIYDSVAAGGDNQVDIISQEDIGYFQTMIISATNATTLLDSLTVWGFLHDDNIDAVTDAISDYVDRSWYFVTMQVDSTALAEYYYDGYYYHDYYYGGLDPITLTFPTEEPVYPMKISALSAAEDTRVHVYFKSAHRMTFPGASTHYANRLSSAEWEGLEYSPFLRAALRPGDFLTKLRRGYRPSEMTEDITFTRADSDEEFVLINYSGWPVTTLLLVGPPCVWGVWKSRRRKRTSPRGSI